MVEDLVKENKIFVRDKDSHFQPDDLPVIQNLIAMGYDAGDIGVILGYQGSNWKVAAGKTLPEYKEAMEIGQKMADAYIVSQIFKQAVGYDYDEVIETFKAVPDFDKETGEPTTKLIKTEEKVHHKHALGNGRLAEFLALNRLPGIFKKQLEITKRGFEIQAHAELSADQINRLAGRLMELIEQKKQIASEVVSESVTNI